MDERLNFQSTTERWLMLKEERNTAEESKDKPCLKRSYSPPQLIVHGTIGELTKQVGTKGTDGLVGSRIG